MTRWISTNRHSNDNLLAGGGFRHGQHLAFDRQRNYPLPNLFVSMLQRLGLDIDRFASSTGTMCGLARFDTDSHERGFPSTDASA